MKHRQAWLWKARPADTCPVWGWLVSTVIVLLTGQCLQVPRVSSEPATMPGTSQSISDC